MPPATRPLPSGAKRSKMEAGLKRNYGSKWKGVLAAIGNENRKKQIAGGGVKGGLTPSERLARKMHKTHSRKPK